MGGTDSVLLAGPKSVTAALATRIDAESDSFTVETVTDEQAAIEAFESGAHDCVVATDQVASGSGLDLLEAVRARWETVPTVLVATEGSAVVASDAVTAARTVASLADAGAEIARQVEAVLPDRSRPGSETGSRSDYRHLFEEMNEGMAVHKLLTDAHGEPVDYRILRVNQQYERILGLERHDVEGKRASNVYKTEAPPFLKQFARVVETGESTQFETFYEPIEKHLEISAFRPESGLFATVFSDVTERKQAKQDLEQQTAKLEAEIERREAAESRYRSLFENNPVVIWEEDFSAAKAAVDEIAAEHDDVAAYLAAHPEAVDALFEQIDIIDVNRKALEYYEAESKAELMANLDAVFTNASRETNWELWATIADGGTHFRSETVSKTLNGNRRDEILEVYVPEEAAEDYSRVYVTAIDISKRRDRERELATVKERLELALEGGQLGVWDWNMHTDEVYRDKRWAEMLGYEPETVGTKLQDLLDLIHPEDRAGHENALEAHLQDGAELYQVAYRMRTAEGDWKWIESVGKVVDWDVDGGPQRAVGIHQAIDEQRRTRERLEAHNELLQAVDRILRHNLHTDMNVVLGYGETIEAATNGRISTYAGRITETSRRLLDTVDKQRSVVESLADPSRPTTRDIGAVVDTVIAGITTQQPAVTIERDGPEGLQVMATDAIDRAIEELVENAIRHAETTSPTVSITLEATDSVGRVRVADEGPTIPEMERTVLTEEDEITPLYHGSGFGLWLVSQVVRRSDGALSFEEREPQGNIVTIELPRADR